MENYHQKSKWSRFCILTTTIIFIVVVVTAFMPLYNGAERNNIVISIVCGIALVEMISWDYITARYQSMFPEISCSLEDFLPLRIFH